MKITKLSVQVKNPDRVNVFIDNKYTLSLTLNQVLEQKLKVGKDINQVDINLLQKISQDGKVRARALEWSLLRPHSKKELKQYLQKKQVQSDFADKICDEFVNKKYVDDRAFAVFWVENRAKKLKSNRVIQYELMLKGISAEIIKDVLIKYNSNSTRLQTLIAQKQSKYQDINKLKQYLLSKGYNYSEIAEALAEVTTD